jgi:pimeloyl-ACP methyl ester carboxylesterase
MGLAATTNAQRRLRSISCPNVSEDFPLTSNQSPPYHLVDNKLAVGWPLRSLAPPFKTILAAKQIDVQPEPRREESQAMRTSIVLFTGAMAVLFGSGLMNASPATPSQAGSLYSGPAPSPGPALLYSALANAPQLQNTGIWKAPPILISGASAYRRGEFIYQDFLFDDTGAKEVPDPNDPRSAGNLFSKPDGTYTYPTNPVYADNAADFVEFRVKPTSSGTAFRITLNTMNDPTLIGISIAIGGTPGFSHPFPHGANVSAPADLFLTVFPSGSSLTADLLNAITGMPVGPAPSVAVDTTRRQIQILVPLSEWNPTGQVVNLAAGIGLWDKTSNQYLLPQATASATAPGGAGTAVNPPAFFNVAFRSNEPMPTPTDPASTSTSPAWWRDEAQAEALASGDITALHASVDFTKLAARVDDETGVPTTGPMDRIMASHFELAQGEQFSSVCFPSSERTCTGEYLSRLQPYAIYIPLESPPPTGYGMTLLLHSLSTNYNQFLGSKNQSEYGQRGSGSIVLTPEARGPDGFYLNYAGADVFEAWADVASHYPLNPAWTAIGGYSMGGIGTFKLAQQFPDLFARGHSTVGFSQAAQPGNSVMGGASLEPSLRNIPILMWNMAVDELVPATDYLPTADKLDSLGYQYELDVFLTGDHLTLAINDEFGPGATFLGTAMVNRNPPHITYVYDPAIDYPALSFVANHAYWISGLQLRSTATPSSGGDATGTIDAFSHGFGVSDPIPSGTQFGTGTLTGGTIPDMAYTRQFQTLSPGAGFSPTDRIDLNAQNISAMTINVGRANVDCNVALHITSDGPLTVRLAGCDRTVSFGM